MLAVRARWPGRFPSFCRLRTIRGLLGAHLLGLAFGTRVRDLSARLLVRLCDRLLALGVGGQLLALLLNLRSQVLGLDLRLDLLLLEAGFLLAALGLGSRLGGVAIRVPLSLLESSFAGELLVTDGLARHLLGLSGNLADEAAGGALACVSGSVMYAFRDAVIPVTSVSETKRATPGAARFESLSVLDLRAVVTILGVGIARPGLGQAAADHVGGGDDRDVEPSLLGDELVGPA